MRDGIYKDMPVARHWKSVMRSCERSAERGDTLTRVITKACWTEMSGQISPQFLQNLNSFALECAQDFPGFGRLQLLGSSRSLGGTNTPFENEILTNVKRLERSGCPRDTLVIQAVADSLDLRRGSVLNQAQLHYVSRAGEKAKPFLKALRTSNDRVQSQDVAGKFLRGEKPSFRKIRRAVDVDGDDLSVPQ